mgnify:CR=1 FL=1
MISKIIIKKELFFLMLISFLSFSQDWNDRASSGVGLSGFSVGLIILSNWFVENIPQEPKG